MVKSDGIWLYLLAFSEIHSTEWDNKKPSSWPVDSITDPDTNQNVGQSVFH